MLVNTIVLMVQLGKFGNDLTASNKCIHCLPFISGATLYDLQNSYRSHFVVPYAKNIDVRFSKSIYSITHSVFDLIFFFLAKTYAQCPMLYNLQDTCCI